MNELQDTKKLEMVLKVAEKTIGCNIEPISVDEIPEKIERMVAAALKAYVKVEGNGLNSAIKAKIEKLEKKNE